MLLSYHIDFLYYLISLNTEYFTIIVGSKSATDVADFLDDRGDDITITEELFRAAAGNIRYGNEIMKLLRKQRREEVKVTAKVVLAAAENTGVGKEVIELLLERQPEDHVVTESVRRGAAQNLRYGIKIRELLVDYRTSQVAQRVVEALVQRSHDMDKRSRILAEQRDEFLRGSLSSTQTDLRTLESDESIRSYTLSGSNISGFDETEIEEGSSVYVDHLPDLSPPLDPELGISASYLPVPLVMLSGAQKSIQSMTSQLGYDTAYRTFSALVRRLNVFVYFATNRGASSTLQQLTTKSKIGISECSTFQITTLVGPCGFKLDQTILSLTIWQRSGA